MNVAFIAVDLQEDFVSKDGALSVPGADSIRANVDRLMAKAVKDEIEILITRDEHKENDGEFLEFPPHCVQGTDGAELIDEVNKHCEGTTYYKSTFDIFADGDKGGNPHFASELEEKDIDTCVVFGVATDICVKFVVKGLIDMGMNVLLVGDACAGLDGTAEALFDMCDIEEGYGVEITSTDAICI